MISNWNKLKLLMWKNWLLTKRNLDVVITTLLYPILSSVFLNWMLRLTTVDLKEKMFIPENPLLDTGNNTLVLSLAYSPCNNYIQTILKNIEKNSVIDGEKVVCFRNAKVLEEELLKNDSNYFAGIVFEDKYSDNRTLDSKISVEFRFYSNSNWYTDELYPYYQEARPRSLNSTVYYDEYFLGLQILLTKALLKITTTNKSTQFPLILTNKFPYPPYNKTRAYSAIFSIIIAVFLALGVVMLLSYVVSSLAIEKENQLKESMKVMGLPGWLHMLSWFLYFLVFAFFIAILMTLLLNVVKNIGQLFLRYSDTSIIFVFFIMYLCSLIALGFLLASFIHNSATGEFACILCLFITFLPCILQPRSNSLVYCLASSLLTNCGFGFAIRIALKYEALGKGLQWSNIFSTIHIDETITFGAILLMFLFNTIIYLLIAFYIEAIFPGDFGIAQPWYFPFTLTYWCGNKIPAEIGSDSSVSQNIEFIEENSERLPAGVRLKNLSKTYGSNQVVNRLNLDMYKGHITVLLGHNGAGKTTTMSMITGMIPPTSGTAIVEGYDIRTNIDYVRNSMGLCLQHNVLFSQLTVEEHLIFFGSLKGLQSSEIEKEIDNFVQVLELEDKVNSFSSTLSGGMKRKLSVAISLCGNSRVVMLDEPTAGMDPSARRTVWELLQQQKTDRTILLTTHFMDEADLLGDRIAIMLDGEIKCAGSSFFLKKKYGTGYYMIMDVQPTCDPKVVTGLLRRHISSIQIQSHIGSELSYALLDSQSKKFEPMLSDLEQNSKQLKINSYGISLTPLEEVFMKVGADKKKSSTDDSFTPSYITSLFKGHELILNHIHAKVFKKYKFILRNWGLFGLQLAIPILILISGLLISIFSGGTDTKTHYPPLTLTLDSYTDPITVLNGNKENSYYNIYKTLISKGVTQEVDDISNKVLELSKKDFKNVMLHYIIGASFNSTSILAWYNDEYYHSAPLSLQLVLNAILAYHKPNTSFEFINHPFPPRSKTEDSKQSEQKDSMPGFDIALKFSVALTFIVSCYIVLCIKENVSKSKHLQYVSGMNIITYWGINFLWDMMTYLLIVLCILILVIVSKEDGFKTFEQLGCLSLLLICYGICVIPFVYLFSFIFQSPAKGLSILLTMGLMCGYYITIIMRMLENKGLLLLRLILHVVFLLLCPIYGTPQGIMDLQTIDYLNHVCPQKSLMVCKKNATNSCCRIPENYLSFARPGIGLIVLFAFISGIIYFYMIFLIDIKFFKKIFKNKGRNYNVRLEDLEEDVLEERKKVKSLTKEEISERYSIVLDDLTKCYKQFLAVNNLCLTVQPFECFGLLGVNGAGKTTAFKMLTGDEIISSGEAWTNGLSLTKNLKGVQKLIGYCPQFDALLDHLTAGENLKMYALIRGVPSNECNNLIESLAHQFDFYPHLNKKIGQLSGGNKRKVSTAVALIGNPQIIYLDEPTTGMDPATKRFLWKALCKIRDSGKTIILTSHSMEECQALCTRLGIMVNGQFKCLGSKQRLKNKFAHGYSLTIKLKKQPDIAKLQKDVDTIKVFIAKEFPKSTLKECHQQMLNYTISSENVTWSNVFGSLERNKDRLNIEDYSIGQGSLEQVFLSFTKQQY